MSITYKLVVETAAQLLDKDFKHGKDSVTSGEAIEILEELDVPDAQDRVAWFNKDGMDLVDVVWLARIHFYTVDCGHCRTRIRRGVPCMQGTLQDYGLGDLCEECAGLYLRLKGFADE